LFVGLFEVWRFREHVFPVEFGNASESGNFVLLFPVVILLFLRSSINRNPIVISILLYIMAMLIWMCVQQMEWVSLITGMFLSPPARSLIGVGIGSIYLVIIALALTDNARRCNLKYACSLAALTFIVVKVYGWGLSTTNPSFYNDPRILGSSLLVSLFVYGALRGVRWIIALSILIVSLPGMLVNPVARGLGPLMDSQLIHEVNKIDNEYGKTRWVVIGGAVLPQALRSAGVQVFNGVSFSPQLDDLKLLDPKGIYEQVWNRYAHIAVESNSGAASVPEFSLVQGDVYVITLDVCSESLKSIGVTHLVYNGTPSENDMKCLESVSVLSKGFGIYKYIE
jgi:hypothetical protein